MNLTVHRESSFYFYSTKNPSFSMKLFLWFNNIFKGWLPGNYNGKISCHSTWSKDGSYTKAKALQAGRK